MVLVNYGKSWDVKMWLVAVNVAAVEFAVGFAAGDNVQLSMRW